jgi:hypothetical protein
VHKIHVMKNLIVKHLNSLLLAGTLLLLLSSCNDKDTATNLLRPDVEFYALTNANVLLKYNAKMPESPMASMPITGLASGEMITSIDFRPATGQLYGISSASKLYIISTVDAKATMVGSSALTTTIVGADVSLDFNPTVDRIRLVTATGQNLRLHPELGTVAAIDGNINGVAGAMINSAAYTNSTSGATTTTLYDIDAGTKKLYKQDPPNNGTLAEVGSLGINFTGTGGFDIKYDNSIALAALQVDGKSKLYQININSGAAAYIADFSSNIIGLTIAPAPVAYAVTEANALLIFNPMAIGTPISKPLSGLSAGVNIVGIDFRPANGQLYALGSNSMLYTINTASGAATAVGIAPFTTLLSGTSFGFDFNPTVDRIRVVSNTGQNLRLNPNDGLLAAADGNLNPGTPMVNAVAYSNNMAGATTTTMYVLDAANNKLSIANPPNNGTLTEVGSLGVTIDGASGFDIGGTSGKAWAVLSSGTTNKLYSINLTTGAATAIADFPVKVRGFAVGNGF